MIDVWRMVHVRNEWLPETRRAKVEYKFIPSTPKASSMEKEHRDAIAKEFETCIDNTITRLKGEDTHRPFHRALLSDAAIFWSRFERSFSSSFGQRVIEKVSKIVALAGGATKAENQRKTEVQLTHWQLSAIDAHIRALREGTLNRRPNWGMDLEHVKTMSGDLSAEKLAVTVTSDMWWVKGGIDHFMSIKTVKPNIDQTAQAKRDLLKLAVANSDSCVFFGLYYNPYGEDRANYNWTPPMGVFDFHKDPVVLIGRDYWETVGGVGTYDEIIQIAEKVGEKTRPRIEKLEP